MMTSRASKQARAAAEDKKDPLPPQIPSVSTRLGWRDHLGGWAVRWGIRRMGYRVEPGVYRVGQAQADSPVLVTANYKLSFDALRRELGGIDAWILVLDTKGVNVWCAAGKGSFGTQELVQRIARTNLAKIVSHRRLILPQLGATGVAGPVVKSFCGFTVVWGPVLASDLPAFLAAGQQKTLAMRTIRFDWYERLVLTPLELVQAAKWVPVGLALAAGLAAPFDGGWLGRFLAFGAVVLGAWPIGAVAFPLLLPVLPFRAFGLKGLILGLVWVVGSGVSGGMLLSGASGPGAAGGVSTILGLAASALISLPAICYLAMNFTGASTFTCQAGATSEVKTGLPLLAISLGLAVLIGMGQVVLRLATGL